LRQIKRYVISKGDPMNNPRYLGLERTVSRGVLASATCCMISALKIINLPSLFLRILEPVAIPAVEIIIRIESMRLRA
jgi:hypothetical protein